MVLVPFERFIVVHAISTLVFAAIAFLIRWLVARQSTKDWFVGWVVFVMCVGGFFSTGLVSYIRTSSSYFIVHSLCGFLVGLIFGNVIGAWVWKYYRKEIEREDDDA